MARPISYSLLYFPLDVNTHDDNKIIKAEEMAEQAGFNGDNVLFMVVKLYSLIYGKEGYYIKWDNDMAISFAKKQCRNIKSQEVTFIINSLIDVGIFNRKMYQEHGILTSYGIQKRFVSIIAQLKRKATIKDKYLINSSDSELIQEETTGIQEETITKQPVSTQKERKGKEINNNNKGGVEITGGLEGEEDLAPEKSPPLAPPPLLLGGEDLMRQNRGIDECAMLYKTHAGLREKRYLAGYTVKLFIPNSSDQVDYELLGRWVDCWIRWRRKKKQHTTNLEEFCQHFPRWLKTKDMSLNPDYENRFEEGDNANNSEHYIPDTDPNNIEEMKKKYS